MTTVENTTVQTNGDLPEGWAVATLGDLCEHPQYGWTTSAKKATGGLHLLRTTDISNGVPDWATVPFCDDEPGDPEKYLIHEGDIVVSRAGSVGISYLVGDCPRAVFASYLIRLRALPPIRPEFLQLFLRSPDYWSAIADHTAGIAVQNINATKLRGLDVPTPPVDEQKRIVAKVEKLLARVNAARERLAKVPALLKRFRQSVLAAACSGQLTADWRAEHPAETGTDHVADVNAKRRAAFDVVCLSAKKMQAKAPRQPENLALEAPSIDTGLLPSSPESWPWATIQGIATTAKFSVVDGPFGSDLKLSDYADDGSVPVLTINAMYDIRRVFEERKITIEKFQQIKRSQVVGGDILMAKIGSTYGLTCAYPDGYPTAIIPANMCKISPDPRVLHRTFLKYWLDCPAFKGFLDGIVSFTAQPAFSVRNLKPLPVPLPSLAEQQEIVRRVEALFALADKIESRVRVATPRVEKITQAILAKAFRGELVPTEAELARQEGRDYEPAAVLLERIRATRVAADTGRGKPSYRRRAGRSGGGG